VAVDRAERAEARNLEPTEALARMDVRAVREYKSAKAEFIPHPLTRKADAAIEALADMVLNPRPLGDRDGAIAELRDRAEQAEAEVARLEWMVDEALYLHNERPESGTWSRADLAARWESEHGKPPEPPLVKA
jgi:hypothetical protein